MSNFLGLAILSGACVRPKHIGSLLHNTEQVSFIERPFSPYQFEIFKSSQSVGEDIDLRERYPAAFLDKLLDLDGSMRAFSYGRGDDPRALRLIIQDARILKVIVFPKRTAFLPEADREFYGEVSYQLSCSGQTAFWVAEDESECPSIRSGLKRWILGRDTGGDRTELSLLPSYSDDPHLCEMNRSDGAASRFVSYFPADFEAGPSVSISKVIGGSFGRGVLFSPIRYSMDLEVKRWMERDPSSKNFNSTRELRLWKAAHVGHKSFTVIRHPVLRSWLAYLDLVNGPYGKLRGILRNRFSLNLSPSIGDEEECDKLHHNEQFIGFLKFLNRNLHGQTSVATRQGWSSQINIVSAYSRKMNIDMVLREWEIPKYRAEIESFMHCSLPTPDLQEIPDGINTREVHRLVQAAYWKDYIHFGIDFVK